MLDAHKMTNETSLVLLRHGESTFNAQGLYQGCNDEAVLTEKGRANTRATANLLADIQFDAVYVSPLRRARETAATLQECLPNLPVNKVRDELREIDLPMWEGLPFDEVRARFADDYSVWKLHPERLRMTRKTSDNSTATLTATNEFSPAQDIHFRAKRFLDYVQSQHAGDRLLVVAHGGINRALISIALSLPISHLHAIAQSNCAVNMLRQRVSGTWSLDALNLTASGHHIPNIHDKTEIQLLLSTQELASKIWSRFSLDAVVGEHSTVISLPRHDKKPSIIVLNDPDNSEFWWNKVEELRESSARRVHLVADSTILACLLGRTVGLHPEEICSLALQPNSFHVIQLPPKPQRAIALLINGTF